MTNRKGILELAAGLAGSAAGLLGSAAGGMTRFASDLAAEVDAKVDRIPADLNEYGYDPWGYSPKAMKRARGALNRARILRRRCWARDR